MKALKILGYISYAVIPIGTILWAFSAEMVRGAGSFFALLGRVAVCYAVALAVSEFGVQKIAVLNSGQQNKLNGARIFIRYLFYVLAFFGSLFLLGVMLLGDSIGGNDDFYPFMRR